MTSVLTDTWNPATLLSHRFRQEDIPDLSGRAAIVTGGSTGIGFYDALALARAGARVTIISADVEHGKRTESELNRALRDAGARTSVTWCGVDFAALRDVDALARTLAEREERLDILICNAGIGQAPHGLTNDGLERHFEVNALAHYVFVMRLLPLMKRTAAIAPRTCVRVVMQSSEMHRMAPSDTRFASKEEINKVGDGSKLYGRTKLGLIYLARGLEERRLKDVSPDAPILSISVHPGTVDTEVQHQWKESYGMVGQVLEAFARAVGKSAEEGAEASLWAATSTDIFEGNWRDYQGKYFSEPCGKPDLESKLAKDRQIESNFWKLCADLTEELLGERL